MIRVSSGDETSQLQPASSFAPAHEASSSSSQILAEEQVFGWQVRFVRIGEDCNQLQISGPQVSLTTSLIDFENALSSLLGRWTVQYGRINQIEGVPSIRTTAQN